MACFVSRALAIFLTDISLFIVSLRVIHVSGLSNTQVHSCGVVTFC